MAKLEIKDNEFDRFEAIWRSNGFDPVERQKVEIKDAIATSNAAFWLPKVFSNQIREAQEPLLVGTQLLDRINYQAGQAITFPAVGALVARDLAEGQAYPEVQLQVGGATTTANIGKVGLAVRITEEMERYSQFDIIGLHVRAAGRALARHKEKKIFNFISAMGVTCFDNLTPSASMFGVTHGRDIEGAGNGSVVLDDVFDTWGQILHQGFTANTLLMHPLTWVMFVKDPVMRHLALMNGGSFYGGWSGNPSGRAPWDNTNGLGPANGQNVAQGGNSEGQSTSVSASALEEFPQTINSAPVLPNRLGLPLRILVSPFVKYDPATRLTDIYMFDSSNLGALLVDEEVTMDEWNDQSVDIRKMKFRERYGIAIFEEGQAIGVMRNVKVVPNQVVLPAQSQIDISGGISNLDPSIPVV